MPYELKSARYLARDALLQAVNAGDTVVDATMGNGHDTLFLAEQVGPEGHVCAFDIQAGSVPAGIASAVFNLGWLPGGDHTVTTRTASTRQAVLAALELLKPGGIVTICAYPGHPEGEKELEMLIQLLSSLSNRAYNVLRQTFLNAGPGAPECFVIQKLRSYSQKPST